MILKMAETRTKTQHTFDVYYDSGYTRLDVPTYKLTLSMLKFLNHCITFEITPNFRIHERRKP